MIRKRNLNVFHLLPSKQAAEKERGEKVQA
jgi:hypothetical protein